jgi:hypothetical protein
VGVAKRSLRILALINYLSSVERLERPSQMRGITDGVYFVLSRNGLSMSAWSLALRCALELLVHPTLNRRGVLRAADKVFYQVVGRHRPGWFKHGR